MDKNKECLFTKNTEIILYGAASIGILVYRIFIDNGFNVIGFVDKRANEIHELYGLPVWTIDEIPETIRKKDIVFFVSIKNVFEHEEIVKKIVNKGCYNIIYKAFSVLNGGGTEEEQHICNIYDDILGGNIQEKYIFAPTMKVSKLKKDFALIENNGASVIAYVPIDYIFTNHYAHGGMKKWSDVNILALFTHIKFFEYLSGNMMGEVDSYLNEYCVYTAKLHNDVEITDAWKQNVLRNRAMIYEQMNLALDIDYRFFERNAAEAIWNRKGYFNLLSGKHRTTFLVSKGKNYIPLRISIEDYQKFLKSEILEYNQEFIVDNNLEREMIFHPFYYKQSIMGYSKHYNIVRGIVQSLSEEIYWEYDKIDFSKISFIDATEENFVGRYLAKMGTNIIKISDDPKEEWLDYFYGVCEEKIQHKYLKGQYKEIYMYVAYEDMYIRCKEVGIDFIKKIYVTVGETTNKELECELEKKGIGFISIQRLITYLDEHEKKILVEIQVG